MRSAILLVALATTAPGPTVGERMLSAARPLIGVPYDLGGRLQLGRGTDCQGVVFYAAERVQRCTWRSFSVMPTKTVASRELGAPVEGAFPTTMADLDVALLRPGDVVLFLGRSENTAEPALTTLDGASVWVWHMGLYAGDGRVLHASPFAGTVVDESLADFVSAQSAWVHGLAFLRLDGAPSPARCRRGARMPDVRPAVH